MNVTISTSKKKIQTKVFNFWNGSPMDLIPQNESEEFKSLHIQHWLPRLLSLRALG